ncbi:MAG: methyltransferase domain-containing protein [Oscillospiraceae bacterium]|nr:methyltransferase domain-containing protein [Oscillospiraceae bacterium]
MISNFKIEKITPSIFIQTSDIHTFGTDAFLLANFSESKKNKFICDLGTGCGIIPAILYGNQPTIKKIYGIDIQPQAIDQFSKGVFFSNLQKKLFPVLADIKDLPLFIKKQTFDLVCSNPPYKINNTGILNKSIEKQIANHEILCTNEDIIKSASLLLKFKGRFTLCQRPERLVDVLETMRRYNIEPKRLIFIQNNSESSPWLFLVEGVKGGKSFLKIEPPFYMDLAKQLPYNKKYLKLKNRM